MYGCLYLACIGQSRLRLLLRQVVTTFLLGTSLIKIRYKHDPHKGCDTFCLR